MGRAALAVAGGGALPLWPAFPNGCPLVFSDTGAFLAQTAMPFPVRDKPVVHGPPLRAFHWRFSLWPAAAAAQALLPSSPLWVALRTVRPEAGAGAHPLLVSALCACTAAPWFASLLVPDAPAPALVPAMAAALGWGESPSVERAALLLVVAAAAAAHLSHLPLLATLLLAPAASRRWRALRDGEARPLGFLLCAGVGVLANAAATGALSGPHDRHGARIAWLVPLAGLLAAWPREPAGALPRGAPAAGAS